MTGPKPKIVPSPTDAHDAVFAELRARALNNVAQVAETTGIPPVRGKFRPTTGQTLADVGRQTMHGLGEAGVAGADLPGLLQMLSIGSQGSLDPAMRVVGAVASRYLRTPMVKDWASRLAETRTSLDEAYGAPMTPAGRVARSGANLVGQAALAAAGTIAVKTAGETGGMFVRDVMNPPRSPFSLLDRSELPPIRSNPNGLQDTGKLKASGLLEPLRPDEILPTGLPPEGGWSTRVEPSTTGGGIHFRDLERQQTNEMLDQLNLNPPVPPEPRGADLSYLANLERLNKQAGDVLSSVHDHMATYDLLHSVEGPVLFPGKLPQSPHLPTRFWRFTK
jgi:hypothetical protein